MNNVVNLSHKKIEIEKKREREKLNKPDALTIKLWRLSMEIDDLIKKGVLDDSLPPDEIAAIIAHRLGTLISCSEKSVELSEFCCHIIERMNSSRVTGEPA
ncbi:hypothetical protein [Fluviispira multicolorata]|uniref:Uncharacterized protein n=1 Tax=Fluviispira multicolorata TaxID=2654512 RepID=A0A833JHG0_9BACT|nr:hypothetical protein [Fluviispira multicolorata]KAB8033493.1 hypothetical protein GCL57_01965 [Fluviispira multicolorata]